MRRRALAFAWAASACGVARAVPPGDAPADPLAEARREYGALAHDASRLPPTERIPFVNIVVNQRVDYLTDSMFGPGDAWQTPLETLVRGRGDCEDIAITKFFLLLAAGLDPAEVRLLYALYRDLAVPGLAIPHLVAIARHPYDDPFVLDNLNLILLPLSLRSDLEPVFSFDRIHLWQSADGPLHGSSIERLPAWRRLLARVAVQMR